MHVLEEESFAAVASAIARGASAICGGILGAFETFILEVVSTAESIWIVVATKGEKEHTNGAELHLRLSRGVRRWCDGHLGATLFDTTPSNWAATFATPVTRRQQQRHKRGM